MKIPLNKLDTEELEVQNFVKFKSKKNRLTGKQSITQLVSRTVDPSDPDVKFEHADLNELSQLDFLDELISGIKTGKEASVFGLYEVSERGTSWMGPLLFSIVIARTGSYRQALLSLIVFFVVGLIGLWFTDTDRGIHEAGNLVPSEAGK